jgi:hypothetical protein
MATAEQITRYRAADGTLFDTQGEAEKHEAKCYLENLLIPYDLIGELPVGSISDILVARASDVIRILTAITGRVQPPCITLTVSEIQSGIDRVKWAQGLIEQLPENHDGRNSWLLNYGIGEHYDQARNLRNIKWSAEHQAADGANP